MSDCLRIQILDDLGAVPEVFIDANGGLYLDLEYGVSVKRRRSLPNSSDVNELKDEGALGFNAPLTPKNVFILQKKTNPAVYEKDFAPLNVIVHEGGTIMKQDALAVIRESSKGFEVQIERGGLSWIKGLKETNLTELDWDDYTITSDAVRDAWANGRVFQDGDTGINWLFAFFGGWVTAPTELVDGSGVFQKVVLQDVRPVHSPLAIMRKMFCMFGWRFESPILETETFGRIWYDYLLDSNYLSSESLLNGLKFLAKNSEPFTMSGVPFTGGLFVPIDNEIFDNANHYNPNNSQYTPQGAIDTDLICNVTAKCIDFGDTDGSDNAHLTLIIEKVALISETYATGTVVATQLNTVQTFGMVAENIGMLSGETAVVRFGAITENSIWEVVSIEFFNEPNVRPFNEGDTFNPADVIQGDLTGLDYAKGVAANIGGLFETNWATRTVRLLQPFTKDVFGASQVEGFFRDTTLIDLTDKQLCDSERPTPLNKQRLRYTRLEFQQTTDPAVQQLKLDDDEPLHSRTIDWGNTYIDGTDPLTNPLYEPTLNDGAKGFTVEGYPWDMPFMTDNDQGNVSYDLGARCLLFGSYGQQWQLINGEYVSSIHFGLARQFLDQPTILVPHFYQLSNAFQSIDFEFTPFGNNLVYGNEVEDLYTICYREWLIQSLQNIEVEALYYLNNFDFANANFRDLYKLYYAGRDIFARLVEVADFSGCNDDASRLTFLPLVTAPFCTPIDDVGDGQPCVNNINLFAEQVGDCWNFSYEHDGDGTIASLQWQWRAEGETVWTNGGTGETWQLCGQTGNFEVRLLVTFEEENCNTVARVISIDVCGNAVTCILNAFQENDEWFVEFILGGEITCRYTILIEYNINSTGWQIYTEGSPVPVPDGAHVEFRVTVTWIDDCSSCEEIVLECDIDIDERVINCDQNLPELVTIEVNQQGVICYEFDIAGTYVSALKHFIVRWECAGGEQGTWQVGDEPICCDGELCAYALVFWCDDCPPVCTPQICVEADCAVDWQGGSPQDWAVCNGCVVNLRDAFLPTADSGGSWTLDFVSEGCTGSQDGDQPPIGALDGDNPVVDFGTTFGCWHFTYHSPWEIGNPCYVDPVSFIVNVLASADAGTGGGIKLCQDDAEILLWSLVISNNETGVWSGNGTTSDGYSAGLPNDPTDDAFDPTVVPVGVYLFYYTVTVEVPTGFVLYGGCSDCLEDELLVVITVNSCDPICPEAGTGETLQACGNCVFDLFDHLTGADAGGVWDQTGGAGTVTPTGGDLGTVDFTGAPSGTYSYTYTQQGEGCDDVAFVTVILSPLPNAGVGVDFELCEESDAYDVEQAFINGDSGGTYTIAPILPSGTFSTGGILDPAAGDAGVYTITRTVHGIAQGECFDTCVDTETVDVTISAAGCTTGLEPAPITICQDGTGGVESIVLDSATLLGATCAGTWWSFGTNDCAAGNNTYNGNGDVFSVNGGAVGQQGIGIPDGATVDQFQNVACHLFLFIPTVTGNPCDSTTATSLILDVIDCGGGTDPCTDNVTIDQTACVASVDTILNCTITSYQWQESFNGGVTWQNISGATGTTYTGNEDDLIRLQYICVGDCAGVTNQVILSGCETPTCTITFSPASIDGNGDIVANFTYSGLVGNLMWLVDRSQVGDSPPDCNTCGGWINATGNTVVSFGGGSGTFTHTPSDGDHCYRLRLWDSNDIGGCNDIECEAVTGTETCSVAIIQTSQTCDFTMTVESGINGVAGNKFDLENVADNVRQHAWQRAFVDSSCAGTVQDELYSSEWKAYARYSMGVWGNGYWCDSVQVRDTDSGGAITTLDLNPITTPYKNCGGAGACCQTLTAAEVGALTYTTGNGTAAAAALRKLIVNALCIEFDAEDGINYQLIVIISNSVCQVRFDCKHLPVGLWCGANPLDDAVSDNGTVSDTVNATKGFQTPHVGSSYVTPCGAPDLGTSLNIPNLPAGVSIIEFDNIPWTTQTVDNVSIVQIGDPNLSELGVSAIQLIATPTNCTGATYLWQNDTNATLGTESVLYVCAGDGVINLTMTCANQCVDTASVTV